jgi:inosose dehydratase
MTCPQTTSHGSSTSRRNFFKLAGAASLAAVGGSLSAGAFAADSPAPKKPGRAKFHLGMASYTLRNFKLDQALAMTRRLGLEYICLKSFHLPLEAKPDEIAAAAAKVKQAGLIAYGCGVVGIKNAKEVEQAFEYAKAAGMRTIVAAPAPETLPILDEAVKKYDIQLAIHNHGPGDRVWPLPQSAHEKIKNLDKRIGLCVDIGHTIRYGEDPIKTVEAVADRILDLHVKDVTAASAKGVACPAGRGVIDLVAFFKKLVEIGYAGVAALEYEADGNDPLPGSAESIGYFRGILAAIGH